MRQKIPDITTESNIKQYMDERNPYSRYTFVSIKDDPQTRNQKFDVAIGGIILGIVISGILIVIGLFFSNRIDTNTYIQSLALYSRDPLTEVAQNLNRNINSYNLLFLGIRYLYYEAPVYINLYGYLLPQQVLILHPLAYSGWIGLLLSGLNLIPISFQDGGHVLKTIFPYRFTKLIGMGIGIIIWIIIFQDFWMFALLGLPGAIRDINERLETVPNPTVSLTKSRKLIAICFIGIFIILWPLSFDQLIFGIGF
jgi:membrane-associated protease RseP (regulator of RpoE activity)